MNKVQLRHSIQLISFLIFLFLTGSVCSLQMGGLFVACPLGILQVTGATGTILVSAIAASLVLIILTLFFGRVFCGWICPIGTLTEHGGRFLPRSKKGFIPSSARNIKYGLLAAIVIADVVFKYAVYCAICPIGVTCRSVGFNLLIFSPELLIVLLIVFAEALERRAWCKHLCPVGALLAIFSRVKIFRLHINLEKCIKCNRCVKECKKHQMDILHPDTFQTGIIRSDECNFCLQCSEVCSKGAIEVSNTFNNRRMSAEEEKHNF